MRILFWAPYPKGNAPSQRFRFEQYLSTLKNSGIQYDFVPFMGINTWRIIYKDGFYFQKMIGILKGYFRRLFSLFTCYQYNYIFIHRETVPAGPPLFEWLLTKVFRKQVIYDFDDAIWIPNASESNKFFHFWKQYSNTRRLCKWAYKVSCGNEYLCDYAKQYNKNVVYNPTTIDTKYYHNVIKVHERGKLTIGWTGSHSTVQYLNDLLPVFTALEKQFDFNFLVISDKPPQAAFSQLQSYRFKQWNKKTEIADLQQINIGIMPLKNDKWALGKCGFKSLQYFALGIPAIVSPVGVNQIIVDHGINGYLANTPEDWLNYLSKLLSDFDLLQTMGSCTREKIVKHYSVESNKRNFLNLFS